MSFIFAWLSDFFLTSQTFAVQKGQVCLNSHIITHFNSEKKNLCFSGKKKNFCKLNSIYKVNKTTTPKAQGAPPKAE